jgi:hypothetical protein
VLPLMLLLQLPLLLLLQLPMQLSVPSLQLSLLLLLQLELLLQLLLYPCCVRVTAAASLCCFSSFRLFSCLGGLLARPCCCFFGWCSAVGCAAAPALLLLGCCA